MNDNLYHQHLKRLNAKIRRDQDLYFRDLKNEFVMNPMSGQTSQDKQLNKQRILNYVHKYVFLQKLSPVLSVPYDQVITHIKEGSKVKDWLILGLLIRDIFGTIFGIKSLLILVSAIFFFAFEYWLHYYTSVSLKDIHVTYKTIIEKIPPFF